jgi:putative FmdB family regulatory protein
MPTYEYECKACGSVFDVFQSIKSTPLKRSRCEKCGETQPVRRLISTGGAVLFKGSGFYQTDYRSESYKEKAKSESPAKEAGGGDKKADAAKTTTPDTPAKSTPADSKKSSKKSPEK